MSCFSLVTWMQRQFRASGMVARDDSNAYFQGWYYKGRQSQGLL